jgi:heme/copper-type cytochrome/quinol oxidase subunit 2
MAKSNGGGGIGFVGLLQVLFIGLKLTKHIDWSWFWVLAPMWISVSIALIVFFFCVLVAVVVNRR